jgi:MerR family transcriptional regulator, light-induced transcriptional regulator
MEYTIRDLEQLSGVKAHTIRIWEQRYNFLKPSRTETNIRRYSNEELKELLTVALLNKYGFKISQIDQMSSDQRAQTVLDLSYEDAENENLVNKLIGNMADLDQLAFEELLNRYIAKHGFHKTITSIIFSFLDKVGILWHTSHIIPAQEHVVSNIIRQKILVAIDAVPVVKKEQPLFVLFLPQGEFHELGLLYVLYLLRCQKLPVVYLGADVPLKDLKFVVETKKPRYLYLHLTSFPRKQKFQSFLKQLSSYGTGRTILVSGTAFANTGQLPPHFTLLDSLEKATSFISSLK